MSSRVQTDTHAREEEEEEKKGDWKRGLDLTLEEDADGYGYSHKRLCVYRASPLAAPATVSLCIHTHTHNYSAQSALGYISHCFGQEKKPKEDGRQTVYCVSISRWIYRAASGRRGAQHFHRRQQRLCVGVHGVSNNKTLIASRTIDVDHEPPPPCHMLVSSPAPWKQKTVSYMYICR